jgi:hypothetical protein
LRSYMEMLKALRNLSQNLPKFRVPRVVWCPSFLIVCFKVHQRHLVEFPPRLRRPKTRNVAFRLELQDYEIRSVMIMACVSQAALSKWHCSALQGELREMSLVTLSCLLYSAIPIVVICCREESDQLWPTNMYCNSNSARKKLRCRNFSPIFLESLLI